MWTNEFLLNVLQMSSLYGSPSLISTPSSSQIDIFNFMTHLNIKISNLSNIINIMRSTRQV